MAGEQVTSTETPTVVALTRTKIDKHGRSQFRVKGNKLTTVRFGASFFKGAPPAEISITATGVATHSGSKAKLTKEERAALPKLTPAEKVAQAKERAQRSADRAARLEAALNASTEGKSDVPDVPGDEPAADAGQM